MIAELNQKLEIHSEELLCDFSDSVNSGANYQ